MEIAGGESFCRNISIGVPEVEYRDAVVEK